MKKLLLALLSSVLLLSLAACGARSLSQEMTDEFAPSGGAAPALEPAIEEAQDSGTSKASFDGEAAPIEPMVIRNANLTLVVRDPAGSVETIAALAEQMGGFVVQSNVRQSAYGNNQQTTTEATITIRVPAEELDQALDQIKTDAIEVRFENVQGEDVTQQYTDLQSRLRNLEAAEGQLLNIMDAATDTEDVLDIFGELRQVREEIEVIKGQMKYYEESARFSSIDIQLIPDALAQPLQIGGWQPQGTAKSALESLVQALQFIADAVIWFGIFCLPILILIGVPGFFIVRAGIRMRRRRKGKPQTQDPPEEA